MVSGKAQGEASPPPFVEEEQQEGRALEEKVHCIALGGETGACFAYCAGGMFRRCVTSWWDVPRNNIIRVLRSLENAGWMLEVFSLLTFVLLLSLSLSGGHCLTWPGQNTLPGWSPPPRERERWEMVGFDARASRGAKQ